MSAALAEPADMRPYAKHKAGKSFGGLPALLPVFRSAPGGFGIHLSWFRFLLQGFDLPHHAGNRGHKRRIAAGEAGPAPSRRNHVYCHIIFGLMAGPGL